MWLAIALGVPLALTGIVMDSDFLVGFDFGINVRAVHRLVANKFALILAIMMLTGFAMWLIPILLSRRAKSKLS